MWQSRPKHQQNQYQGRSGGQKQWHRYKAVHAHDVGMARAAVDKLTIPKGFLISLAQHIICVAASFCINAYTIGPTLDGLSSATLSLLIVLIPSDPWQM
jgi:hypothetical protein